MANVFLNAGETRPGFLAPNDVVFGNSGTEAVTINTGATNVRVEGTVEGVTLLGAPSAFTYRAEGNNLVVFSGGVQVARIIVQDDANGTTINFNGGSVTANVGAGGLTLGGTVVPTTAGPVVPGDFDQNAQLTSSLQNLSDAQAARDEFLASEEADLDDDADTVTTEAEIEANLTDAQAALAAAPTAAQLDAAVVVAQADFDAVQDRVDAVAGLNEAIEDFRAAEEASEAADESVEIAQAEVLAAEARYEARNGAADIDTDFTVTRGGVDIIVLADDGETLVLAEGVTEANNAGVTQLLASLNNLQAATEAADEADDALQAARDTLDLLDTTPGADTQREALADFRAATEAYDAALTAYVAGDATSEAALVAAYDALIDAGAADVADGYDPAATNAVNAAAIDADSEDVQVEINETDTDLEDAVLAAEAVNPIYADYEVAEDALTDAQDDVEARAELVADVQDAQALADQLDALNDDVDAAVAAIEELGFETPISLDGAVTATARSDIFVASGEDATIARFGRSGDDLLFIGGDISLVELEASDDITDTAFGSATVTEAFIQQVGGNTVIYVENEAFNGSDTDGTFDGYTITLTGVTASSVTFDGGYFSIA